MKIYLKSDTIQQMKNTPAKKIKYLIITYGCQMNMSDSERIAALLESLNCEKTVEPKAADLIVFNTCSVRQTAEDRVFGQNKILKKLKEKNKQLKVVLTGCMTHYPEKTLRQRLPLVDIFLDIKDLPRLPKLLGLKTAFRAKDYFSIAPKQSDFRALIPISTGCDNFCSYCVVPRSRGREYSRPAKEILREAKTALLRPAKRGYGRTSAKNGAKEIWLLGQNVNSYGLSEKTFWGNKTRKKEKPKIQKGRLTFADLLREINKIEGDFWIRFTSPHPKDFSDDLIAAMKECEKFPKYVNLPVQSGDDKILKKMNRNYTASHYEKLVNKLRKAMPEIAISTDTIVGFPGETKKQFKNTIKLYKKLKFDMAFIAKYSPRPGTASALAFKDDVPPAEKTRRFKALTDILRKTSFENNKKHFGKIERVLIEEKNRGRFFGRNAAYKLVEIIGKRTDAPKIGEFVNVKITKAKEWALEGVPLRGTTPHKK